MIRNTVQAAKKNWLDETFTAFIFYVIKKNEGRFH